MFSFWLFSCNDAWAVFSVFVVVLSRLFSFISTVVLYVCCVMLAFALLVVGALVVIFIIVLSGLIQTLLWLYSICHH